MWLKKNLICLPEAFAAWRLCSLPRRITGACREELRGDKNFFFILAKAQSRKGIERSLTNLSLLGSCLPSAAADSLRLHCFARDFFLLAKPSAAYGRELTFVQSCFF